LQNQAAFKMKQVKAKSPNTIQKMQLQLPVIAFTEDNVHMIYCPALDLTGYGKNEGEAQKSFETILAEYLKYTTTKGTLFADLKKLGWVIKKTKKQTASPPPISELLEKNEEFSRIFNNFPFKKYDTGIILPAA
jgi:hypothetical protein